MELSHVLPEVDRYFEYALDTVYKYIHKTPMDYSATLSKMVGGEVYLKCENLQKTGSFKVRGAITKISRLRGKTEGVVAVSAGNHAQGVAYAASIYGLKSIIVMPRDASISKVEATKNYGGEVVLAEGGFGHLFQLGYEISRSRGYEFVHPYDDPEIIAGQGTLGWEILQQVSDADTIVVPIGGGGLISGISYIAKKLRPSIRIIGVESEAVPKASEARKAGRIVDVEVRPTLADGLSAKRLGELTFQFIEKYVDEIYTVSEEAIAQAIYFILERSKMLVEGAGATTVAMIFDGHGDLFRNGKTVFLLSGGNIDLTSIYRILLRGLSEAKKIVSLEGYALDVPGTLARIAGIIAEKGGNIVDVFHDRMDIYTPPGYTNLKIIVEVPNPETIEEIKEMLRHSGIWISKG